MTHIRRWEHGEGHPCLFGAEILLEVVEEVAEVSGASAAAVGVENHETLRIRRNVHFS